MPKYDLNLASHPFPAYRLLNVALALTLIVLVLVSAWQVYGFTHFSSLSNSIRAEEQKVRVEDQAFAKQVAELESGLDRPEAAAKLNEIGFLNRLIERKGLSWTGLFANLEDMVPPSVQLLSLSPTIGNNGAVSLRIQIQGRSIADVTRFIEALERSAVFERVAVSTEEKHDTAATTDVEVALTTDYYPQKDVK